MRSQHCFFVIAMLIAPAAAVADEAKPTPKTIAHIKLSGELDESPVPADPLFGAAGENFKTKLDRIAKAKNDPKVVALFLEIGDLQIGFGKLGELRRALADFRASGKKVYAWMEDANTMEYLLACGCGRRRVQLATVGRGFPPMFRPRSKWLRRDSS